MKTLTTTKDGSNSLYVAALDEYYHSQQGAIQESRHVFIEKGLKALNTKTREINILEVGFGTGLNAYLTILEQGEAPKNTINYTGLEPYPLSTHLISDLNYPSKMAQSKNEIQLFNQLHEASFENWHALSAQFNFFKSQAKLQDLVTEVPYDLVYYDAFGPEKQPEMWDFELFKKICQSMKNGGIFVTYCAKGQVRRDLEKAGFKVERLPGPPGKREMLRAVKVEQIV